jgi:hypothetical protein
MIHRKKKRRCVRVGVYTGHDDVSVFAYRDSVRHLTFGVVTENIYLVLYQFTQAV